MLQIAPSGYRCHAARKRKPELLCARAKRDEALMPQIQAVWQANMQVYGADNVWHQMNREGTKVARCTVERLMKRMGLHGVLRGQSRADHGPGQSSAVPAGPGQSPVQSRPTKPTVGVGLHLCQHLAGLAIRGLCN